VQWWLQAFELEREELTHLYDWMQGIPNKGKLLTALSLFFFDFLSKAPETKHIPNHVITSNLDEMPQEVQKYRDQLEGRAIWVRRAQVLPVEAIVRGYITGEL
jgi:phosphoribosylaminoimidazole-succinocarboxamide synthase